MGTARKNPFVITTILTNGICLLCYLMLTIQRKYMPQENTMF